MGRRSSEEHLLLAISKVLDPGEDITDRARCWAAVRRTRVPLLFLGRQQYEVVLTDRRAMLFSRRRRRHTDEVALAKRYESLSIEVEHQRIPLLQQRVRVDRGDRLVIEWRPRHRAVGRRFARAVAAAEPPATRATHV